MKIKVSRVRARWKRFLSLEGEVSKASEIDFILGVYDASNMLATT